MRNRPPPTEMTAATVLLNHRSWSDRTLYTRIHLRCSSDHLAGRPRTGCPAAASPHVPAFWSRSLYRASTTVSPHAALSCNLGDFRSIPSCLNLWTLYNRLKSLTTASLRPSQVPQKFKTSHEGPCLFQTPMSVIDSTSTGHRMRSRPPTYSSRPPWPYPFSVYLSSCMSM